MKHLAVYCQQQQQQQLQHVVVVVAVGPDFEFYT